MERTGNLFEEPTAPAPPKQDGKDDKDATDGPELVANLWYITDGEALIFGMSVKLYALVGAEREKRALLRTLAVHDWRTVPQLRLPPRYVVTLADGSQREGVTGVSSLSSPERLLELFDPALTQAHGDMMDGVRLPLPAALLYVATALVFDGYTNTFTPRVNTPQ